MSGRLERIEALLAGYRERELLRFLTCGSVDDGKSTLIGRLLHDSHQVFEDQLAAAARDSRRHGTRGGELDLALLTDGLQAEREQGITIDVAYRYFATAARKFIIADTPGHEQYTRNMATGASGCDLAVILLDARKGVLPQTRRHAYIAAQLGIRRLVAAVNKMDLVGWNREVFEAIRAEFAGFAAKLQVSDVFFIPLSALLGDNVVDPSAHMPWFGGGTLLHHLETVHIAGDRNLIDLRFPVQLVLRPGPDFRGYAGTMAGGVLRPGEEVLALPSGRRGRVARILSGGKEVPQAFAPMAVTVTLSEELDLSRGDMLVHPDNAPQLGHNLEAMLVWMDARPLETGRGLLLKQTSLLTPATVSRIRYRINVDTLRREEASGLALNEVGRVRVETVRPVAFDPYRKNRATGAFILIDRLTNATVAAGMVVDRTPAEERLGPRHASADAGRNVRPRPSPIPPADRARRLAQKPFTVWLTGLPRSGKTTLAYGLEKALFGAGKLAHVVDGENLRLGLCRDLGFSGEDRRENLRRAAEVARLACDLGLITVTAFVSPLAADREMARAIVGPERFLEVYCDAPLEICERRDTEGLYARARAGELPGFTGIDAPYEAPAAPALVLPSGTRGPEECLQTLLDFLRNEAWLEAPA